MTFSMFLFDENVEPKRSQGQRVAAKDLRVLNMARKVGILLAAEAYLLEKEYAKRTTPPQKKHVFFRSGRVFPCHIIMYSYMYIYILPGKNQFRLGHHGSGVEPPGSGNPTADSEWASSCLEPRLRQWTCLKSHGPKKNDL